MQPKEKDLIPEDFPIQAPCDVTPNDYEALYGVLCEAVRTAIGVGSAYSHNLSGLLTTIGPKSLWDHGVELSVGVRVLGIKKRSTGPRVLVDYAIFAPDGEPLAWSDNLSRNAGSLAEIEFTLPDPPFDTGIDEKVIKRVRAMARALQKPPKTPPFESDGPPLKSVAVSTTGDVAAADATGVIYVWEGRRGHRKLRRKAGNKPIRAVAFSPDGLQVVAGYRKLSIFSVTSGKAVRKLAGHPRGEVRCLAWSPCGRFIASASGISVAGHDNSVAIWDASSGEPLSRLKQSNECLAVRFTEEGKALVFTSQRQGSIRRVEVGTGVESASWETGTFGTRGLARVAGGWAMLVEGELVICDLATLEPLRRYPGFATAQNVASTDEGRALVAKRDDGTIHVVDVSDGASRQVLPLPDGVPYCDGFASSGPHVVGYHSAIAVRLGGTRPRKAVD